MVMHESLVALVHVDLQTPGCHASPNMKLIKCISVAEVFSFATASPKFLRF